MAVIALVSICMSFIPLMTNTVKADVEPSPTTGLRVTGAQVKVVDGATQEDGKSQFAVYFHTEITEDFYNGLTGAEKQFGMIVGPEAMMEGFSSLPAEAPVASFDEAVGAVVTEGRLVDVDKSANFRFVGTDLQEAVEFTNGIYTFEAGVVFDEEYLLESEIEDVLKLAAATRLTAVPYYVEDGTVKINALDAVTRTAKDILIETEVRVAYGSSESDFDQATIGYFGQKYVGSIEEETREYYMEAATGNVYATNANNELVGYMGEDLDQANIASGAVAGVPIDQIVSNPYSDIAVGDTFSMAYTYNDGTIRVLPVKMVTKVLSTVKDFFNDADGSGVVEDAEMIKDNYIFNLQVVAGSGARNPQVAIKGYYVLANNIDLGGNNNLVASSLGDQTVQIFNGSADVGFRATLDGRGFALTNGNPGGSSGGMFGAFYGATVKNIAFDGFQSTRNDGAVLILGYAYRSTFENVYIRIVGNENGDSYLGSNAGLSTFGISDTHGGSSFTNIVFESTVGLGANKTNDHNRATFSNHAAGNFTNTTIIGMPVTFKYATHATDTTKYVLNLTLPASVLVEFGVESKEYALSDLPEAVTNAYGNLIANLESKTAIDIAYLNFIKDRDGRAYYIDNVEFSADDVVADTYISTTCWELQNGKIVWASLGDTQHSYNMVVTAPTCTEKGYTTYTCTCGCGDSYRASFVPALGHDFISTVNNGDGTHTQVCGRDSSHVITEECHGGTATCTEKAICQDCNLQYGEILDHDYHIETILPTCTEQGYTLYICSCGDTQTKNYKDALGHNYGDWVSNGNNTHTKVCVNNKNHTVTVKCSGGIATCTEKAICKDCNGAYGEMLDHVLDAEGYCTVCEQNLNSTEGLLYELSDDGKYYQVVGYNGTSTIVNVPSAYNGLPVTSIGQGAFYNCDVIVEVIIGDAITSIGYGAFSYCDSLQNVTLGKDLTSIAYGAFGHCSALTNITLGENVDYIGHYAFAHCTSLQSVVIADGLTTIGDGVFGYCSSLTNVTLPNTLTAISYGLFVECTALTTITIGDKVTEIADKAFNNCNSLTTVVMESSVTSVGADAFIGCPIENAIISGAAVSRIPKENLKTLVINGGKEINANAFNNCDTLESVTIGSGITTIGDFAFYDCDGIESITIGKDVTNIGEMAFNGCNSLRTIVVNELNTKYHAENNCLIETESNKLILGSSNSVIPSYVTVISEKAFYDCKSLLNITIPSGVTMIEDEAFYGCEALTSVTMANSVTSLGDKAFYGCSSLLTLSISDSVSYIGRKAFENCDELQYNVEGNLKYLGNASNKYLVLIGTTSTDMTSVSINENCRIIYDYALANCTSLTSIIIPDSVLYVAEFAFNNCPIEVATIPSVAVSHMPKKTIRSVTITSGEEIFSYALANCTSLTSVTIPDTITTIGEGAFYNCSSLQTINIPNSVSSIGISAFENCSSLQYNVSESLKYLGSTENPYLVLVGVTNTSISSVSIHADCRFISDYAFKDCDSITSLTIGDNIVSIGKGAFYGCDLLKDVTISDNVTSIGASAFANCPIENAVVSAMAMSYIPKTNLKTIVITSGESIPAFAFYGCTSLTSVSLAESVTSIGNDAFAECSSLSTISLGNNIINVGSRAFENCNSLQYNVSGNLKYLGNVSNKYLVLMGTTNKTITSISINANCKVIYDYALADCTSLTSVVIPNNVVSIGDYAFSGCTLLTEIDIAESVAYIGKSAFYGCTSLESITVDTRNTTYHSANSSLIETESNTLILGTKNSIIPNYVTAIGNVAFYNCIALTTINIPDGVTSIGNYAFYGCTALDRIELPNSLTYIGDYAFSGCTAEIVWGDLPTITTIGQNAFNGYKGRNLVIPTSVTTIEKDAFANCTAITEIIIPSNVTTVTDSIFTNSIVDIIYCEVIGQPSGWVSYWKAGCTAVVVWGYNGGDCELSEHQHTILRKSTTKHWYECQCGHKLEKEEHIGGVATCTQLAICSVCGVEYGDFADHTYSKSYSGNLTHHWKEATCGCDVIDNYGEHVLDSDGWCTVCAKPINSVGSITYEVSADGTYASVVGFEGDLVSAIIAQTYDGVPVTSISTNAFYGCSSLTSVVIPDSITSMGVSVFYGCDSLLTIYVEAQSKPSGWDADWNNGCDATVVWNFNSVEIGGLNYGLLGDNTAIVIKQSSDIVVATIPSMVTYNEREYAVTAISAYAFANCRSLVSVIIPNSVTSIGFGAFKNCISLESMTIPFVGEKADGSGNNTIAYMFGGVEYSDNAIYVPTSLKTIVINGGTIAENALNGCVSLESIVISDNVTSIGLGAFAGCTSIKNIVVPFIGNTKDGTTNTAFGYIFGSPTGNDNRLHVPTSLKSVIVTGGTIVHNYVFYCCESIESIKLPNTITSIGTQSFYYCSSLKEIVIPDSVTTVGEQAFARCSALASVTIGKSVTSLANQVFENCTNISKVNYTGTIDQWVEITFAWGGNPIYHAKNLYINDKLVTEVVLTTATKINTYAFYNCATIEAMYIPEGVVLGTSVVNQATALTIYVQATSQPSDWATDWETGFTGTINWGHVHNSEQPSCIRQVICEDCGAIFGGEGHEYTYLNYNTTEHWYECYCGSTTSKEHHHGGDASSTDLGVCIVCGQEYGNFDTSGVSDQINTVNGVYHEVYIEEGIISTNANVNAQIDTSDKGLVVGLPTEAMDILVSAEKIYDGSTLVTFEDGRIVGLSAKELGSEDNVLRIIKEEKEYTLKYMYVTRAIRNAKDLSYSRDEVPTIILGGSETNRYIFTLDAVTLNDGVTTQVVPSFQIDGYYVLADNIYIGSSVFSDVGQLYAKKIYSGCEGYTGTSATDVGFTGTFDGRGHSIEDLTTWNGGLFGYINGGTIKNTAFIDMANSSEGTRNIFADYSKDANFENLYVSLKEQSINGETNSWSNIFSNGTVHVKDSVLESFVLDKQSSNNTNYLQFLNTETGSTYENVHCVGTSPLAIGEIYVDGADTIVQLAITETERVNLGVAYGDVVASTSFSTKFHGVIQAMGIEWIEFVSANEGVERYDTVDNFNSNVKANASVSEVFMATGYWNYDEKTGALEWKNKYHEKTDINENLNMYNGIYHEVYIEDGITASDKGLIVGLSDDAKEILTRATAIYDGTEGSSLVTYEDGKIIGLSAKTLGSESNLLTIIKGGKKYTLEYMYVTRAIRNVYDLSEDRNAAPTQPWYNMAEKNSTYIFEMPVVAISPATSRIPTLKIDGYYVLANNVDFGGLSYDNPGQKMPNTIKAGHAEMRYPKDYGYNTDVGFTGTFDGRGYSIENFTTWQGGMFGYINGGTIKNVAFVNACNYWQHADKNLFADISTNAYFENIYVSLRQQKTDNGTMGSDGSNSYYEHWANIFSKGTIHVKNSVLESFILEGYEDCTTNYMQFLNTSAGSTYENVHCVGSSPLAITSYTFADDDGGSSVKLMVTEKDLEEMQYTINGETFGFNYDDVITYNNSGSSAYQKFHYVMTAINQLAKTQDVKLIQAISGVEKYDTMDNFMNGMKANSSAVQTFMDTGCWRYNQNTGLLEWATK